MRSAMEGMCEACSGTGRFQGRFSGPEWPECPACKGTGMEKRQLSFEEVIIKRLNELGTRASLQSDALEIVNEEFRNVLAHLVAATSSYEKYAGNSERHSVRDALFNTKLKDYNNAINRARETYAEFESLLEKINNLGKN